MEGTVYIDGRMCPFAEATVSVGDYGFLYGDGVFEGIRCYGGRVFRLREHIDRLVDSAKIIRLPLPHPPAELAAIVRRVFAANGGADGYVRLTVTRGVGPLGLDPAAARRPTTVCLPAAIALFSPAVQARGLRVITAATRRTSATALSPRAKTLNYLNNGMAKLEASVAGADDALMLNDDGLLAEATSANVFVLRRGVLRTPAVEMGILEGITRADVMALARARGLEVATGGLTRADLYTADECFFTGTAVEIVPVTEVDGRPVGAGQPGPLAGELRARLREVAAREGEPL
jgi:branched-chain amino acid aminotransferase